MILTTVEYTSAIFYAIHLILLTILSMLTKLPNLYMMIYCLCYMVKCFLIYLGGFFCLLGLFDNVGNTERSHSESIKF